MFKTFKARKSGIDFSITKLFPSGYYNLSWQEGSFGLHMQFDNYKRAVQYARNYSTN